MPIWFLNTVKIMKLNVKTRSISVFCWSVFSIIRNLVVCNELFDSISTKIYLLFWVIWLLIFIKFNQKLRFVACAQNKFIYFRLIRLTDPTDKMFGKCFQFQLAFRILFKLSVHVSFHRILTKNPEIPILEIKCGWSKQSVSRAVCLH